MHIFSTHQGAQRDSHCVFHLLKIEGKFDRLTFWLHPPRAVADPILPCGWIFSEATRYAIRKDTRGVVGRDEPCQLPGKNLSSAAPATSLGHTGKNEPYLSHINLNINLNKN